MNRIRQDGSPFILKKAVTNLSISEEFCQRGIDLLAAGAAADAAKAFRTAIAADPGQPGSAPSSAYIEAHHGLVRALRDAGRLEQSVGAALALTALTPADPLAHTVLSISLQIAGHVPEAEAAAARARVLEWKIQLQTPANGGDASGRDEPVSEPPEHEPLADDPPHQDPPAHDPSVDDPPVQDPPKHDPPVQDPKP